MREARDKVVLLTGASSGIGEALAREFAGRGARLVLLARRIARLEALAHELDPTGTRVAIQACDVTLDGDSERGVQLALQRFGRIDIAIANAGFGVAGRFEKLTLDDYRRQFETNVYGVLRTARACVDPLKATCGSLVVMGSVAGHVCMAGASPYGMSKFALRAWANAVRSELHREGVAVTLISPGFVSSEIRKVDNRGALHQDARDPIPDWLRMPANVAARKMVRGILHRKSELIVTAHGKAAVLLNRLSPGLIAWIGKRGLRGRTEPR